MRLWLHPVKLLGQWLSHTSKSSSMFLLVLVVVRLLAFVTLFVWHSTPIYAYTCQCQNPDLRTILIKHVEVKFNVGID